MQQLLKIETIPIEYQLRFDRPRLEVQQADNPRVKIEQTPAHLNLRSKNIEVRLDTIDMRRSMGLRSTGSMIEEEGQKGFQAAQRAISDQAQLGNQAQQIHTGITIAEIVSNKILQDLQPNVITAFIPNIGPAISWDPNQLEKQYVAGMLENEWQINQNVLNYIPGKFQMIISQYPDVQIEYLGEPNYVPPSANPNYQGESS